MGRRLMAEQEAMAALREELRTSKLELERVRSHPFTPSMHTLSSYAPLTRRPSQQPTNAFGLPQVNELRSRERHEAEMAAAHATELERASIARMESKLGWSY